eukprot:scaffold17003_cov41-Attheya_sp.AAC.1
MQILNVIGSRVKLGFMTWPSHQGWIYTFGITSGSTLLAGGVATVTGFVDPVKDMTKPNPIKMLSAFLVPSLVEELLWRVVLLPHPTVQPISLQYAMAILFLHVGMHPVLGELELFGPRGRFVFCDPIFLVLATIVLGGATASYSVSGGSVYAAIVAHAVPVTLWRDCFGGEQRLLW